MIGAEDWRYRDSVPLPLEELAKRWWDECSEDVKCNCSIWLLLALFTVYVKRNAPAYLSGVDE